MAVDNQLIQPRVDEKLTELLFQGGPMLQTIALVNAVLAYVILVEHVNKLTLVMWLACLSIIILSRLFIVNRYWHCRRLQHNYRTWFKGYLATNYASALTWATLIFIPAADPDIWIEAFISLVIIVMSTTAMVTLSPMARAAMPYSLIILGSILIHFILGGGHADDAIGVIIVLYSIVLIQLSFRIRSILVRAIKAEIENENMFNLLKNVKDSSEKNRE